MKIDERDTFNSVARLVSSLFTSALVDETIEILAEKAFIDHWFNKEYDLNITKKRLHGAVRGASLFNSKEICMSEWTGLPRGSPRRP